MAQRLKPAHFSYQPCLIFLSLSNIMVATLHCIGSVADKWTGQTFLLPLTSFQVVTPSFSFVVTGKYPNAKILYMEGGQTI